MVVFTTISPNFNERETKAMDSWCKKFKVYSINTKEEIEKIKDVYKDVNFVETLDVCDISGKKMIKLNAILNQIKLLNPEISCIVNSDIILNENINFDEKLLNKYLEEGILIGSRLDIENDKIEKFEEGYDIFIFKSKFIDMLFNEKYVVGMPWFDYWIPCSFLFSGKKVFHIEDDLFYHVKHWNDRDEEIWIKFGEYFCEDIFKFTNGDVLSKYFKKEISQFEIDKKLNVNYGEIVQTILFFIRKHLIGINIKNIKKINNFMDIYESTRNFRPSANYPIYPPYHTGLYLEEYFLDYYINSDVKSDRILIPIFWTNYYINNKCYMPDPNIQNFLNSLDPNKKYFTVSQHDDAPREFLPPDTLSFSAGGNHGNIPIPLICSRMENIPNNNRDIFCSFVGSITHPIRQNMYNALHNNKEYYFSTNAWTDKVSKENQNLFIDITSRSLFTLCPRGYGRTSFRLYECLQLGSIPVYIYDIPWTPFSDEIKWEDFCIMVPSTEIYNINKILYSISGEQIVKMLKCGKEVYEKYFTMESMSKNILKRI